MSPWTRLAIVVGVMLVTIVVARLIDRRIARRDLPPEAMTRYRVLRRSVTTTIVFVGLLSALLVIPQVRAVAGGFLASSAVLGIVVGFASQRTLGNFVAGLLIAFTQPLRLGDDVVGREHRGRRRGDRAHLHVRPHRERRPARDPEREAGLGYHPQLHDSQSREGRRDQPPGSTRSRPRRGRRPAADARGRRRRLRAATSSADATVVVRVPAADERCGRAARARAPPARARAAARGGRLRMTPPRRGRRGRRLGRRSCSTVCGSGAVTG